MSKVTYRKNIRVEVHARSAGDFDIATISGYYHTEVEELLLCEQIADDIRRHVDNLPSRGDRGVRVVYETEQACSHCKREWEEDENGPLCCQKAQDEWDAAKAVQS